MNSRNKVAYVGSAQVCTYHAMFVCMYIYTFHVYMYMCIVCVYTRMYYGLQFGMLMGFLSERLSESLDSCASSVLSNST